MLPRPLRVKCCPILLPSAPSNFIVSRRKFTPGSEQTTAWHLSLGTGTGLGGPAPGLCLSGPPAVCLLPGRGPTGTLASTQLSSAELVLSPAFLPCPQAESLEPPAGMPQLDLGLEQPGVSGWGWEGGEERGLMARSRELELLQKGASGVVG